MAAVVAAPPWASLGPDRSSPKRDLIENLQSVRSSTVTKLLIFTLCFFYRYEGQRDMLYNQTYNLDQVAFAAEGLKDAQQTVYLQSYLRKPFNISCHFPSRILALRFSLDR
jgi:hypothetical protein